VGGRVYFTATEALHGRELWSSDGTGAGTALVKDITPGASGSSFRSPAAAGDTLFFVADDNVHGYELWKTDGTNAGTALVKEIAPGDVYDAPFPYALTGVGGRLFFTADDGVHGQELWKTRGSSSSTVMVRDIARGDASALEYPGITHLGGTVFFIADDGAHGDELWKTTGERSSTAMVKDIDPCPHQAGALSRFADVSLGRGQGMLFFAGSDGTHGSELWKSDGTRSGTAMVKDINTLRYGSYPVQGQRAGPADATHAAAPDSHSRG